MRPQIPLTVFALSTWSVSAFAQPISWLAPVDGVWNDPLRWSSGSVPGDGDEVVFVFDTPYTVSLGPAAQSAATVTISNRSAVLAFTNGRSLSISDRLTNHGLVVLNPDNLLRTPKLWFRDGATISGTGLIRLGAPSVYSEISNFSGDQTLIHEDGHTIAGQGRLSAGLVNRGLVVADVPAGRLEMLGIPKVNESLIRAAGGQVVIHHTTIDQTLAGSIVAEGGGSVIELDDAIVRGGVIEATEGGAIRFTNSDSSLTALQLRGPIDIGPGVGITLSDVLLASPQIHMVPSADQPTNLAIEGSGSVTDVDSISLNGPLHRVTVPGLLSIGVDQIIHGEGIVEAGGLINHGLLAADRPDAALTLIASELLNYNAIAANGPGSGFTLTALDLINHGAISADGAVASVALTSSNLINHGVISADGAAASVALTSSHLTNHGSLRSSGGSTIRITQSTIDQSSDARIVVADDASTVLFDGSTIRGTIDVAPGGTLRIAETSSPSGEPSVLDGATVNGSTEIAEAANVRIIRSLENNGQLTLSGKSSPPTRLIFEDNAIVGGTGSIRTTEGSRRVELHTADSEYVVIGRDQSVRGDFAIDARIVNYGDIACGAGEEILFDGPQQSVNWNTIRADGGTISIGARLGQPPGGSVIAEGGGRVVVTADITGGTFLVSPDSELLFSYGSVLDDVAILGDARVFRGVIELRSGFTLDGTLAVGAEGDGSSAGILLSESMTIGGNGTISLGREFGSYIEARYNVNAATGPEVRVEGIGRIGSPLTVHGCLAPGVGTGVGMFVAAEAVTLAPTSTLEIAIGPVESDFLWTEEIDLDGTLEIQFVEGYMPPLYWSRLFMSTFESSGRFHTIVAPPLSDDRLEMRVGRLNSYFVVGVYCKADLDGNRSLDFFDISEFLALFNANDPAADLAAPFGTLNFFDISEYLSLYNAGCP